MSAGERRAAPSGRRLAGGALRLAAAAAGAALLLGLAAWCWPEASGVALSPAERQQVALRLALLGALGGAVGLFLAGFRPLGVLGASLAPAWLVVALAQAPRHGTFRVRVSDAWVVGVGLAALLLLLGLRHRRTRGPALLLLSGALGVAGWTCWPVRRPPPAEGPDILLVTLDTTRCDHFDFCGGDVPVAHTPALSALALGGAVFRQAYAPLALTGPAHTSLLSGLDPLEHGVRVNGEDLPADLPWVPTLLHQAGWETRAWVSASVLDASLGFDRGFDSYDCTFEERIERGHPLQSYRGWRRRRGSAHSRAGAATVELALAAPAADRPTFTWVHLYDAHWPYTPSPEAARSHGLVDNTPIGIGNVLAAFMPGIEVHGEDRERGPVLYRAAIDDLDALVGRVLARVGPDTVVVVAGDHGESLGEHDYLFGHGRLPYAPDTRVPLVLRVPGASPTVWDEPVALADVAPTLLELAGLPVPEGLSGRSLLHPDPAREVVSRSYSRAFPSAVTAGEDLGDYAGIAVRRGPLTAAVTRWQPRAVFDRSQDPRELAPASEVAAADVLARLEAVAGVPVPGADEDRPAPEMADMLKALGYQTE